MDISGILDCGGVISDLIQETYETIWSTNVDEITLIRKTSSTAKNNMFFNDLATTNQNWSIKVNIHSPDKDQMVRNVHLNTEKYKYHVNTNLEFYPNSEFIILATDTVTYKGENYEIQNLVNTELGGVLKWQEFDLFLIE